MSNTRLASVKWFSNRKGFGFLTDLESKDDVFVHHTGISTPDNVYRTLVDGEYVSYEVSTDDNGQKVATNITGVNGGPLLCENPTKKVLLVIRDRDRQDASGDGGGGGGGGDGGDGEGQQRSGQRSYRPRTNNYRGRGGGGGGRQYNNNRGPPRRRYERRDPVPESNTVEEQAPVQVASADASN